MSKISFGFSVVGVLLAASAVTPTVAQINPPAEKAAGPTCADIAALDEAKASALIYYTAGYSDGVRDQAESSDPVIQQREGNAIPSASQDDTSNENKDGTTDAQHKDGTSNKTGAPDAAGADSNLENSDTSLRTNGGPTFDASTIIAACATASEATLISIINANAGSDSGTAPADTTASERKPAASQ